MSLTENRDEFLGFIYDFRARSFVLPPPPGDRYRPIVVDLSRTKSIAIDAALILTAEYHRNLLLNPHFTPTVDDAGWPSDVRGLLDALGFYDLVQPASRTGQKCLPAANGLRFVKFRSEELTQGPVVGSLIEELRDVAGIDPLHEYAYAALMEAVGNVRHHAYRDQPPQVFRTVPRWWSAGSFDAATGTLQFAVYDQGVGIPVSLQRQSFFQSVLRFCHPERTDADVITGAIRYGRTRHLITSRGGAANDREETLYGRGNGLWTICRLIPELPGSSVRIMSGHGDVTFSGRKESRKRVHRNPFCGSLIVWTLRLPSVQIEEAAAS